MSTNDCSLYSLLRCKKSVKSAAVVTVRNGKPSSFWFQWRMIENCWFNNSHKSPHMNRDWVTVSVGDSTPPLKQWWHDISVTFASFHRNEKTRLCLFMGSLWNPAHLTLPQLWFYCMLWFISGNLLHSSAYLRRLLKCVFCLLCQLGQTVKWSD